MLANNKRIPSSIYKTHKQIQFVDECSKFMNQIFYRKHIFIRDENTAKTTLRQETPNILILEALSIKTLMSDVAIRSC